MQSSDNQVNFEFGTRRLRAHLYVYPPDLAVALTFEQATPLLILAAAFAGIAKVVPLTRTAARTVSASLRNMKTSIDMGQ
jgi:hypothetical protein